MSEISCPNCGHLIPADAEVCDFCHAPLKSGASDENQTDGDAAWLDSVGANKESKKSSSTEPGENKDEPPDWLKKIRQRSDQENDAGEGLSSSLLGAASKSSDDEIPDWLKSSVEVSPPEKEDQDWLNRLRETSSNQGENTEGKDSSISKPVADEPSSENVQSQSTSGEIKSEKPFEPEPTSKSIDVPSDLTGQSNPPEKAQDAKSENYNEWIEKLSEWRTFQDQTPPEAFNEVGDLIPTNDASAVELPAEKNNAEDFPDWLKETGIKPEEISSPIVNEPVEIPKWLGDTGPLPPLPEDKNEEPEIKIPDWILNQTPNIEPQNPVSATEESVEKAAPAEEIPAWILEQAPKAEPVDQIPAASEAVVESVNPDEIPDWLVEQIPVKPDGKTRPLKMRPRAKKPTKEETQSGEPKAKEIGELGETPKVPVGLESSQITEPQPIEMVNEQAGVQEPTEPEIGNLEPIDLVSETAQTVEPRTPVTGLPDEAIIAPINEAIEKTGPAETEAVPAEKIPGWILSQVPSSDAIQKEEFPAAVEAGASSISANPEEIEFSPTADEIKELPDWLTNLAHSPQDEPYLPSTPALIFDNEEIKTEKPTNENTYPFEGDELPDWLPAETSLEAAGREKEIPSEAADQPLEKANLPSWLQAMKPVEAAIPAHAPQNENDQRVEASGPLAGLSGVLPGEKLVNQVTAPPIYTAKLKVTDKQRLQADLLQSMLTEEATPIQTKPVGIKTPLRILRIVIALILIAALAAPLIGGFSILPANMPVAPETQAFFKTINQMDMNKPVLLAVDYEPGQAGEMRPGSVAVLQHLMQKNVKILVVSTIPTGPAIGAALLSDAQLKVPAYNLSNRVVSVGYLAGGPLAMQELSSHPDLLGLPSLSNYSAVIVLTENLDTLRAWVEQVQPGLGSTPLLMVVSAQAMPLALPYTDSGQIQGLVAGLPGAVQYEQVLQSVGLASSYWSSLQFGVIAAMGLIFIGWLITMIMGAQKKGKAAQ
jgi:hypothetical protein